MDPEEQCGLQIATGGGNCREVAGVFGTLYKKIMKLQFFESYCN